LAEPTKFLYPLFLFFISVDNIFFAEITSAILLFAKNDYSHYIFLVTIIIDEPQRRKER
jgi:hypothetical protein